mgnify:CR=1 FL=1
MSAMSNYRRRSSYPKRPSYKASYHHEWVHNFREYLRASAPFVAQVLAGIHERPQEMDGEHAPSLGRTFSAPADHITATLMCDEDPDDEEDSDKALAQLRERLDSDFLDITITGLDLQRSSIKSPTAEQKIGGDALDLSGSHVQTAGGAAGDGSGEDGGAAAGSD